MSVLDFHTAWSWVVVVANGVAGAWCLGAHWSAPLRVRPLWWFVVAAEVAIVVQIVAGVWLLAGEGIDAPEFHVFYGFVMLVTVALLYSYRFSIRAWQYLLYGFGGLFLMGLGIRAMLLG